MQKNLTQLEVKISEKEYRFICDPDSPIVEAKQALEHFIKYLEHMEESIKNQQEEQKAKELQETNVQ